MAGLKPFLTCCSCKEKIPREQIIYYGSKENLMKYCPECHKEKISREKFYNFICELFGIKAPGPKIYAQRKKIKAAYGFTDETIMKTLDYLFNVKKLNKGFESIGLVNPQNVEEARKYFEEKKKKEEKLREAEQTRIEKIVVPVKKKERKVELIDIDALLEEDE